MARKIDKGQDYIDTFPKFKKWINECACCHRKGYSPNMPEKITVFDGSLEVYFIKKYFKPLAVNEESLCKICEELLKEKE